MKLILIFVSNAFNTSMSKLYFKKNLLPVLAVLSVCLLSCSSQHKVLSNTYWKFLKLDNNPLNFHLDTARYDLFINFRYLRGTKRSAQFGNFRLLITAKQTDSVKYKNYRNYLLIGGRYLFRKTNPDTIGIFWLAHRSFNLEFKSYPFLKDLHNALPISAPFALYADTLYLKSKKGEILLRKIK